MLHAIHPKLPMRNKTVTKQYYIDQLGFNELGTVAYDDYLMISKDAIEVNSSLFKSSPCTLTPITISTPFFFITSTGKLLTTPPSTNNLPSISTGFNNEGKAALALRARGNEPLSNTSSLPVSIFVPIQ